MHMTARKQSGFTLIELMITVAVVAILAAVAYPNYTQYVQRGYRSEGIAMLQDAAARMERYYAQNNQYTNATLAGIGLTPPAGSTTVASQSGKYALSLVGTAAATTYAFQVTPQNGQEKDPCGTLSISQTGVLTAATGAPANCFSR